MWNSLNPSGGTIFVEEDPSWVKSAKRSSYPWCPHRIVSYATQGSRLTLQFVLEGATLFSDKNLFKGELQVSIGIDGPVRGGLRKGVGSDHDRSPSRVVPGCASTYDEDFLGSGYYEGEERVRHDEHVLARC
ncbi:hypothetical protein LINPERHAP1_LOCUS18754 [Linum perenne]